MRAEVARNVFHEAPPSGEALDFVTGRLLRFRAALEATDREALLDGKVPVL